MAAVLIKASEPRFGMLDSCTVASAIMKLAACQADRWADWC